MSARGWVEDLFRPLVVGTMIGCIIFSLVELIRVFAPSWPGGYLVVFCALTALEAQYSYRVKPKYGWTAADLLKLHGSEFVILFLLLEMSANIFTGQAALAGMPDFSPPSILMFAVVVLCWLAGLDTAADFRRLTERHRGEEGYVAPDYAPPLGTLTGRFFVGGALLLATAGLARISVTSLFDPARASVSGLVFNVLLYFLLGLIVLGQARYTTLRRTWEELGAHIEPTLVGRWVRSSLAFLTLAAGLVWLLPTQYTVGLLDAGRWLVEVILTVAVYLVQVLLVLITIPLSWLAGLFGGHVAPAPRPPPLAVPPPPVMSHAGTTDWVGLIRSFLFWGVVLAVGVVLIRSMLPHHGRVWGLLGRVRGLAAVGRWWRGWWRRMTGAVGAAREALRARRAPAALAGPARPAAPPFWRIGTLPPREQVRYYYLSLLRRARRQGVPRAPAQTPAEYQAGLAPLLPAGGPEFEALTRAFVEAQYSRHEIVPDAAHRARSFWQRVKAALQALRGPAGGNPG